VPPAWPVASGGAVVALLLLLLEPQRLLEQ
jgi:hypothetical protein